jgi:hypothetical protein
MSNYTRVYVMVFAAIILPGCSQLLARSLEITQVDLFSLKGWNSVQVSVDGLWLGMNFGGAASALSKRGLRLFDDASRSPCTATSRTCYVARQATDGGTVDVALENGGRIDAIYVGMPEDPATLPQTIAGRFKGETRRFFFHYSDALRLKLLGPPDRVKKSPTTDAMQGQIYYYDRLGLIVGTSRSLMRDMKTPTPPELSDIEFVMPKPVPQKKLGHE